MKKTTTILLSIIMSSITYAQKPYIVGACESQGQGIGGKLVKVGNTGN